MSSTNEGFVAKIGDLGLAKRSEQIKKVRLDYLRGTALYMAPETVKETVHDPKSDIWALGCVVCKMLTGKSPWDREEGLDTEELLRLIGNKRELPKIPSGISREARDFLKACLVRKPMFRFTAEMLLDHPFSLVWMNLNYPLFQVLHGLKLILSFVIPLFRKMMI